MTAAGHRPKRAQHPNQAKAGSRGTSRPRAGNPSTRGRATTRQAARRRWSRRRTAALWSAAVLILGGVIAAAALTTGSGSIQHNTVRPAPTFTLTNTSGQPVSMASYRGHDVVLYFSEGAGCDACFYQMREFEQHAAELSKAGITILPIVMNPASQTRPELATFGLHTPYLIDTTGSVSRAYGVLGKGMHAGLPGHGFVLIDTRGTERWYGEYPSMYLSTAGLIRQVRNHLSS
jgi:peroxiredoxin